MANLPTLWGASPLNADDANRLLFTTDTDLEVLTRALDDTPSLFLTMDSVSWEVQWRNNLASGDDSIGLEVRVMNGATVLAAADSGGAWATVKATNATITATDTTVGPTSFAYVNTTASKATWDGASIELRQRYSRNMGGDGVRMEVDFARLTGTYTLSNQPPNAPTITNPVDGSTFSATVSLEATTTDPDGDDFYVSWGLWSASSAPGSDTGAADLPLTADPASAWHAALAYGAGSLWIVLSDSGRIYEVDATDGSAIADWSGPGAPNGITFDGTDLWINTQSSGAFKYTTSGTYTGQSVPYLGTTGSDIAYNPVTGTLFQAVAGGNIYEVDPATGNTIGSPFDSGLNGPIVWCDSSGDIYVTRSGRTTFDQYDSGGNLLNTFTFHPSDPQGGEGADTDGEYIYHMDESEDLIRRLSTGGATLVVAVPENTTPVASGSTHITSWDTAGVAHDTYLLRANAVDTNGLVSATSEITVTIEALVVQDSSHGHTSSQATAIEDGPPDEPVITSPVEAASISGDVVLEATVSEAVGQDVRAEWELWTPGGTQLQSFSAVDSDPRGLHHDGTYIWMVGFQYDDVYKFDPSDGTIVDQLPITNLLGGRPLGVAFNPDENPEGVLYVGDLDNAAIYKMDAKTGYHLGIITPAAGSIRALSWNPAMGYLYGGNPNNRFLGLIDPADGSTVQSWTMPSEIVQLTGLHYDGTYLWASDSNSGAGGLVHQLNPADMSVLFTLETGISNQQGVAFDGTDVWIVQEEFGQESVRRFSLPARDTIIPVNETLVTSGATHSTSWNTGNRNGTYEIRAWARDATGVLSTTYDVHTITVSPDPTALAVQDSRHAHTSSQVVIPEALVLYPITNKTLDEEEVVDPPGLSLKGKTTHPSGSLATRLEDLHVYSTGNHALAMCFYSLYMYDISDPTNITVSDIYSVDTDGYEYVGVDETNNRIIVGASSNIRIFNDSNKSAVTLQQDHVLGNTVRFATFDPATRIAYIAWYDNQVLNSGALTAFQFDTGYTTMTRLGSFTHAAFGDGGTAPNFNGALELDDTGNTLFYRASGDTNYFLAIDVTDPNSITLHDSIVPSNGFSIFGGFVLAYEPSTNLVRTPGLGMPAFDVSNLAAIAEVTTDSLEDYVRVERIKNAGASQFITTISGEGPIIGRGYDVVHLDATTPTSPVVKSLVDYRDHPELLYAYKIHWNDTLGVVGGTDQNVSGTLGGVLVFGYAEGIPITGSGTQVTLSASGLPDGMNLVDNGDGTGSVQGAPGLGTSFYSPYTVTVTATDVIGTQTTQQFTMTVNYTGTGTLIGVNDATHAHISDEAEVVTSATLEVQQSNHALLSDNVTITYRANAPPEDSHHGHTSEQVTLTEYATVSVDDSLHGHTSEKASAIPQGALDVRGARHGHTSEQITLTEYATVSVDDSLHGHTSEVVTASAIYLMAVADSMHAQASEEVLVTAPVVVNDSTHGHASEQITLTEHATVTIEASSHDHVSEVVALSTSSSGPVNDDRADAIAIALPHSGSYSTIGATTEVGETLPGNMGATIWFQFTLAESLDVEVSLEGSDYDTYLALYAAGSDVVIASNDDYFGLQSYVKTTLGPGTYDIQVGGYNGQTGTASLAVTGTSPPPPPETVGRTSESFNTGLKGIFQNIAPLSDGYFLGIGREGYGDGSGRAIVYRLDPSTDPATIHEVTSLPYDIDGFPPNGAIGMAQTAANHVVVLIEQGLPQGRDAIEGFRFNPATGTLSFHPNTGYEHPYEDGERATFPSTHAVGRNTGEGTGAISKLIDYNIVYEPWNLDVLQFQQVSPDYRDPGTNDIVNPDSIYSGFEDIFWKPDGTKAWLMRGSNRTIVAWNFTTPWDVTTPEQTSRDGYIELLHTNFDPPGNSLGEGDAGSIWMKPDGMSLYTLDEAFIEGSGPPRVTQWNTTEAWVFVNSTDIPDPTASIGGEFNVSAQASRPTGITFKDDGTRMYILDWDTKAVYQYNLGIAWDVTTASYAGVSGGGVLLESEPVDIEFRNDGLVLFVLDQSTSVVRQYGLSTAWDITTISGGVPPGQTVISAAVGEYVPAGGFYIRDDGAYMFVVRQDNSRSYDTLSRYVFGEPRMDFAVHFVSWDATDSFPSLDHYQAITSTADVGGTGYGSLDEATMDVVGGQVQVTVKGASGSTFYSVDPTGGFTALGGPYSTPNTDHLFADGKLYYYNYSAWRYESMDVNGNVEVIHTTQNTNGNADGFQAPFKMGHGGLVAMRAFTAAGEREGFNAVYFGLESEGLPLDESLFFVEPFPASGLIYGVSPSSEPLRVGGYVWHKVGWDNYEGDNDHHVMRFVGIGFSFIMNTGPTTRRFVFRRNK